VKKKSKFDRAMKAAGRRFKKVFGVSVREARKQEAGLNAEAATAAQDVQAIVFGADTEQFAALQRGSCVVLTMPLQFACVVGPKGFVVRPVKSSAIEKGKLMVCIGRKD